ncbi:MAG: extracellular solute-binding protein [Clostridia bacterium]|nr:extracellular solute-binding protein [Clostridia bacterium]
MKTKTGIAIFLSAALALTMAGCGGAASSSTAASTAASAAASTAATGGSDIHVASWNNAADNLSEIAEKFNAEHGDNGKVIIDYVDSDYSKLKPALAAGSGVPDIFQTQNRDIPAFYNNYGLEAFLDISDIIDADASNWVGFALETCKAEDGKYYAIPWDIGPVAMYYRTDIFEANGIDPATLTTYDKYIEAGKKLKAAGDYYVEAFNYSGSTSRDQFMIYLNQLGGQYYDADGKVKLDSDEMLQATELVKKFMDAGVVMDIPNAWDDRIAAINDGKLVSFVYPAWYMGTMKNSCADLAGKWAITTMPAFEEGGNTTSNAGGSILAVSSTTANPQLCKDFLEYAMKSNDGNDVNTKYGEFPSYTPAYDTSYFKEANDYYGGLKVNTIFAEQTGVPATTWGPYFVDVDESMKTAVGDIILNGADPATAWAAATKDAQGKIDLKG